MIPNLTYTSKNLYTSNQIRSKFTYLLSDLDITGLHTRDFCYLVNTLTPTDYSIS